MFCSNSYAVYRHIVNPLILVIDPAPGIASCGNGIHKASACRLVFSIYIVQAFFCESSFQRALLQCRAQRSFCVVRDLSEILQRIRRKGIDRASLIFTEFLCIYVHAYIFAVRCLHRSQRYSSSIDRHGRCRPDMQVCVIFQLYRPAGTVIAHCAAGHVCRAADHQRIIVAAGIDRSAVYLQVILACDHSVAACGREVSVLDHYIAFCVCAAVYSLILAGNIPCCVDIDVSCSGKGNGMAVLLVSSKPMSRIAVAASVGALFNSGIAVYIQIPLFYLHTVQRLSPA